jgi:hypothetical protein
MRLIPQKIEIPMQKNFIVAFFLLLILCWGAHELTHHFVGRLVCGSFGYMTFNRLWTKDCFPVELIAIAAGPLLSYSLMWLGLFILLNSNKYVLFGYALIFANGPGARLITSFIGGDESYFGTFGTLVAFFLTLPPLIIAYKSIKNRRRLFIFIYFFLVLPSLVVIPIVLLDNFIFIPIIERGRETYNFSTPVMFGIPLLVLVFYLAIFAIFSIKYFYYLLPRQQNIKKSN